MSVLEVQSLVRQCQTYILMHLEELPISHLSLLPLSTRKVLLWQLPIADVCQLEGTKFAEGLDMEAYWKFLWGEQYAGIINPAEDSDVEQYIQQKWGNHKSAVTKVEYDKAMLYGQLISRAIGCLEYDFEFRVPHNVVCDTFYDFLFAVRKIQEVQEGSASCSLKVPPRYLHKLDTPEEDLAEEVVNCFKGEPLTVLAEIYIYADIELSYAHFLREIAFLGVHGMSFEAEFVEVVIQEATCLEVLLLEGYYDDADDGPLSLDNFCTYLSAHPTFWSRFRLLKVLSVAFPGYGYTVSQNVFAKLISKYCSAPTDHAQKVQFMDMTVKSTFYDRGPIIDEQYISFKTIELDHCQFELDATPTIISGWLGHHIAEVKSELGSCCFKITDKEANGITRKRKFSEIESDDPDEK